VFFCFEFSGFTASALSAFQFVAIDFAFGSCGLFRLFDIQA
jgi:hypothetical protein